MPVPTAERPILESIVGNGQKEYIDACFTIGERDGVSPYILMGTLYIESAFGKALTKGTGFGQTIYTGDFIPRPCTPDRDKFMTANPMPGCVKVYWERPQLGNLKAFKGEMWVPAHQERVALHGSPQAAYLKNGGVAGGVGWGFTPWQLDWGSFSKGLTAGAAWQPELATAEAVKLIKSNIATLKKAGLTGETLLRGVIAAYNAGAGRVMTAVKAGQSMDSITAHPGYVDKVLSVSKKVGKNIDIA
jgi:hypothetical protein